MRLSRSLAMRLSRVLFGVFDALELASDLTSMQAHIRILANYDEYRAILTRSLEAL